MGSSLVPAESSWSSSPNLKWRYDVFLSFRGEDTRSNFTSHLDMSLRQKGVNVFIDDKLQRGEQISQSLLTSIEEAFISIVVFSENYASSSWCLDELVKIMKCKESKGHIVFPVFYKVDPSDIRKQKRSVGEELAKLQVKCMTKIQTWRDALTVAANLSGWDLGTRKEADLIHDIVKEVLSVLNHTCTPLYVAKYPVGIDSQLELLNRSRYWKCHLLDDRGVYMAGIYGIGGIGKTTLAKSLYNKIANQFDGSCFLSNVREASMQFNGLVQLQEKLIYEILKEDLKADNLDKGINIIRNRLRSRKVLIILDDVDKLDQLEALVGGHDWFGYGSKIIVTTRNNHLLSCHEFDGKYAIPGLDHDNALQLFSWHAFKKSHPSSDYVDISQRATTYCEGLPLALVVLGSFLCGRDRSKWESILDEFENSLNKDIRDILQISYDGLEDKVKDIFLDISCLFMGEGVGYVKNMLNACHHNLDFGMIALEDLSLITIEKDKVQIHDLIRQMGYKIVNGESSEPGKRSRLWLEQDILKVFIENSGTDAVKAIKLDFPIPTRLHIDAKAFRNMKNLRLLVIRNATFSTKLAYLPDNLKWIKWHEFSHSSLPSCFVKENLVGLDLQHSFIKSLRNRFKDGKRLKYVDLSYSASLEKISDFSATSNLEELYLRNCSSLRKIHESIVSLSNLVTLDLSHCSNLRKLPSILKLKSLKFLNLSYCKKLKKLPDFSTTSNLEKLYLIECSSLRMIHDSIGTQNKLVMMDFEKCTNLEKLPSYLTLKSLERLTLAHCEKLQEIPDLSNALNLKYLNLEKCINLRMIHESIGSLDKLVKLDLRQCCKLEKLPSYLRLKSLEELDFSGCRKLEKFPKIAANMISLKYLSLSFTAIKELPLSIGQLSGLYILNLEGCTNLISLPNTIFLLKSLQQLRIGGCSKFDATIQPACVSTKNFETPKISYSPYLQSLRENTPFKLALLKRLHHGGGCSKFDATIQDVFSSLKNLDTSRSSESPHFIPRKESLSSRLIMLDLQYCNISNADFLEILCNVAPSLSDLFLSENKFISLPSCLHKFKSLWNLQLRNCKFLQEIPNLPQCIQKMDATGCESLARSPGNIVDIISNKLQDVGINNFTREFILMNGGIPKSFSHRTTSNSMRVIFRHHLNMEITLATCSIFKVDGGSHRGQEAIVSCNIFIGDRLRNSFMRKFPSSTSEYTWLITTSQPFKAPLKVDDWKKAPLKASDWDRTPLKVNDWNHVIVLFEVLKCPEVTVTIRNCGVHLTEEVHEMQNNVRRPLEVTYTDHIDQPDQEWSSLEAKCFAQELSAKSYINYAMLHTQNYPGGYNSKPQIISFGGSRKPISFGSSRIMFMRSMAETTHFKSSCNKYLSIFERQQNYNNFSLSSLREDGLPEPIFLYMSRSLQSPYKYITIYYDSN